MSGYRIIAFGGNQLAKLKKDEPTPSYLEQLVQTGITVDFLAKVMKKFPQYKYVITHGNGPQVGDILAANEAGVAAGKVYGLPLQYADAMTQGSIGSMIQLQLPRALSENGLDMGVIALITQVLVDKKDPAFKNPTKPIGKVYSEKQLRKTMHVKSQKEVIKGMPEFLVEDGGIEKIFRLYQTLPSKMYREVVASPNPLEIVEFDAIDALLMANYIPIAVGGGGIPVIRYRQNLKSVPAVIDKDLASAVLAAQFQSKYSNEDTELIILTGTPGVYINFEKPGQKLIKNMTSDYAQQLMDEGHFGSGSMAPKVQAAINAVKYGVKAVYITDPENLEKTLRGKAGTKITLSN